MRIFQGQQRHKFAPGLASALSGVARVTGVAPCALIDTLAVSQFSANWWRYSSHAMTDIELIWISTAGIFGRSLIRIYF